MPKTTDIMITGGGSIIGLVGVSEAGADWIAENCAAEPWQFQNGALWIERRYAPTIIDGAQADGLEVT